MNLRSASLSRVRPSLSFVTAAWTTAAWRTAVCVLAGALSAGCMAQVGEVGDDADDLGTLSDALSTTARVFGTDGDGLTVRVSPSTSGAVIDWLPEGASVQISCQTTGTSVSGTTVWDFLPAYGGYVSDAYLYTGHSGFIPGMERCGSATGTPSLVVRGQTLSAQQARWVRFVASDVVPEMRGDRATRLSRAAEVTWWALKEGVLDLANPFAYSNCNYGPGDDRRIGPVAVCPDPDKAWQVGISGVQAAWRTASSVEVLTRAVHPDRTLAQVLRDAATDAGYAPGTSMSNTIVNSTGRLRTSWLLRESAVGFEAQYPTVHGECFEQCRTGSERTCSWCFGSGWDTSRAYAPTQSGARAAVADIRAILDRLSSTTIEPTPTPTPTPTTGHAATVAWTDGDGLNVRSAPTASSAVVGFLAEGASIRIVCQTTGDYVGGSNVWNRLASPSGYVADYFTRTGYSSWIPGVPRCD